MRATLQRRGFVVEEHAIYRTRFVPGESEADLISVDAIIFASPSAVSGFCRRISRQRLDRLLETPVVCIGPVTARAAKARGFRRITAPKTYTFDSVVEELGRLKTIA
jgi:uroporphyrinogen-III synthase